MKQFLIIAALAVSPILLRGQVFDAGLRFHYLFNNYEYGASNNLFDDSFTLHAVRMTPEAGLFIDHGKYTHRLRAGLDLVKEMGSGIEDWSIFREFIFYYNLGVSLDVGGRFEAVAGHFPRSFFKGSYLQPFFDDDLLFYDSNVEGMLFRYEGEKIFAEIALDWMGQYGDDDHPFRRERFQVLTSGLWNFAGAFNLGWAASFYHFACSPACPNVVDNHMLNPWVDWRPHSWFDSLSLGIGGIFTYQLDRVADDRPKCPMGLWSLQTISKWNIHIDNSFYWGQDLMPYYSASYGGIEYGRDLYFGDQNFHTRRPDASWVDYITVAYRPDITEWLQLELSLNFHLAQAHPDLKTGVFRGWQQMASLKIKLDRIK